MDGNRRIRKVPALGGLVVMAALLLAACTSPTTAETTDPPSRTAAASEPSGPPPSLAEDASTRFNRRWCIDVNLYLHAMKVGLPVAQGSRSMQELVRSANQFKKLRAHLYFTGFPVTAQAVLSVYRPILHFIDAVTPPLAPVPPSGLWDEMRTNAEDMRLFAKAGDPAGDSGVVGRLVPELGTCSTAPASDTLSTQFAKPISSQPPNLFTPFHGMIFYLKSANRELVAVDPTTGARTVVMAHPGASPVAWSPSGDALLFANGDIVNPDGSVTHLLEPGHSIEGSFSPDGREVAYTDQGNLYVTDASGRGSPRRLLVSSVYGSPSGGYWSPDGHKIAFVSDDGFGWSIDTVRPNGNGRRVVYESGRASLGTGPLSWSPDGSRIAFTCVCVANGTGIGVVGAEGSNLQTFEVDMKQPASDPVWSPDGSRIVFVLGANLITMGPHGGYEHYLASGVSSGPVRLTWNPGT